MKTTHEVTSHDDMVRIVTKVDGEVSMTHEYTLFDWTDSVAAMLANSECDREVVWNDGVGMFIYTEVDYE